jgi:hypothetical protein
MNKTSIIIAVIALVGGLIAVPVGGALLEALNISTDGNVITPAALTSVPSSFTWGDITAGTSIEVILAVTNNGATPTGVLVITNTLSVTGLSLSHNSTLAAIPAGGTQNILFTLTASPSTTIGAFSFNIIIDEA